MTQITSGRFGCRRMLTLPSGAASGPTPCGAKENLREP
ncbi:hypothetical protein [Streptomyces sp. NPDC060131]